MKHAKVTMLMLLIPNAATGGWSLMLALNLLGPLMKKHTDFRRVISVGGQIAISLWRLANDNSYRCVSEVFPTGQSTTNETTASFRR